MTTTTTRADSIINAGWIIPVNARRETLTNHSLVIQHGQIVDLLPTTEVDQHYHSDQRHDLPKHLLIPGLVNAHGHAAMTLFRGLADDLPLMSWLQDHIWPAEAQWVNEEFVHDGTQLAMLEMLRSGTTTFSDMYFFPDVAARAVHDARMRCQISFPILDFPTAWARDADDYIHKGLELFDDFGSQQLINIAFGPHAPYTVSDAPLQRVITLAEELDCAVQIHLHETAQELRDAFLADRRRPLQRLNELGLLSPRLQCVHMTQLDDRDIQLLRQNNCHVVHCPNSNLKLASGFCPTAKLHGAGINVALGTDGAASNNRLDLLGEMRTAALLAKAVSHDASAIDAHSALEMATINGARALGIEEVTGSLEQGKAADIAAIDLSAIESQPLYNPLSQLVYATDPSQVSHVWVNGELLLSERKALTLDATRILSRAQSWADKISARP
ncbi:TRZ/ATZ family hydrolase [Aestuariirhabdus litorea]|uniref:5-methylthioadenosine/S-adenosylhomocysteine deaminase n=1 Tax=Aestuariirhabdus litorea TaxID=2528527 RepID=A0A3P3VN92_9GAMM|nr:TRZ/ATZ family hydrolase [Aestuariirhabdus litorea]RRJ84222.1 TRZ/ATZ family hydrolase [Aestuariirhabdus litorea]RWW97444.1 TRZ/ATZ family hydrolase [Endozoicomonadaceae bacterium GTF-13]